MGRADIYRYRNSCGADKLQQHHADDKAGVQPIWTKCAVEASLCNLFADHYLRDDTIFYGV